MTQLEEPRSRYDFESTCQNSCPNHEGIDGTDCEEVCIVTEESAILIIGPPYSGMFTFYPLAEERISTGKEFLKEYNDRFGIK